VADGTVRGRLRGPRDRALLVPAVYQRTQAAAAVGFYRQNSYIGPVTARRRDGARRRPIAHTHARAG